MMKPFPRSLAVLAVSLAASVPLHAQTFGGQAVDAASRAPLVGLDVRLLHHREDLARPTIVDSTKTDERGLFEFRVRSGGIYQAEFGPWRAPYSLGSIDTVQTGGVRRRYLVPTPVLRPPLTAAVAPATTPLRLPTRPNLLVVTGRTAFGAVLGGAAGYLVAELRCGRIVGCHPTNSYPYFPVGAVLGAAMGSGTSGSAAGCRWGFARGVAGSLVGALAGSLIAGEGRQGQQLGAGLGAVVGGTAAVATCRLNASR